MKSPVVLLSSLFDDVERLEPGVKGLDRDIITIESRFEHEGYGFLSVALSALCDAFDNGIEHGCFTCPTNFSKVRGKALPKFLQGLLCKVFDISTGLLLDNPPVHIVKCVREILRLFKKIVLSPKRERKLHTLAVRTFLETDSQILRNSFSKDKVNLFLDVSKFLLPNLDSFETEAIACKHGPGGVAEKVRTNQKWRSLLDRCHCDPYLASKYGFDILTREGECMSDQHVIKHVTFDDMLYDADVVNDVLPQRSSNGTARLITVPKNSTSLRTITAEPVLNMFIQQGLNTLLRDNISECKILRQCLALTDQSKNQNLALIGSRTGEYATIDLSSASDLLSLDLVKLSFKKRPKFLTSVLDCRSTHVNVDENPVKLLKFAGMGNALTFPVQSIIFATLAICGVLCTEGHRPSFGNIKRAARHVRVYGDDIIVRSEHVHQVMNWISSFGLNVNQKKTFTKGNFRESCGVDAYKGYDVSPVYIRHSPVHISVRNPEQLASLVSTSNQLWFKGLYKCATAIQASIEEVLPLPLVSCRSAALGWHSRVDASIAQKWDAKLQRLVFRGYTVQGVKRPDRVYNYASLFASLHSLECASYNGSNVQRSVDWLERSVLRFHTKIRRRWVPAQAG